MSEQLDFLEKACTSGVDAACSAHPNAISADEAEALKALPVDELKKLKEVRESLEAGTDVALRDGNGVLSF